MNFFKKRKPKATPETPGSTFSAGLPRAGDELPASLKAHSQFIKRVNCSKCGALLSFLFPLAIWHVRIAPQTTAAFEDFYRGSRPVGFQKGQCCRPLRYTSGYSVSTMSLRNPRGGVIRVDSVCVG